MDPVVRAATTDDCTELARLEHDARAALVDVRGGNLRLQECRPIDDWPAQINDPAVVVLVGTLDNVVLAFTVMQMSATRDRGVVTHTFVDAGARELGLGDTMIEHAIAAVRTAGLAGIEGTALPGDRDTKNLFERAGITARSITVYKRLG